MVYSWVTLGMHWLSLFWNIYNNSKRMEDERKNRMGFCPYHKDKKQTKARKINKTRRNSRKYYL